MIPKNVFQHCNQFWWMFYQFVFHFCIPVTSEQEHVILHNNLPLDNTMHNWLLGHLVYGIHVTDIAIDMGTFEDTTPKFDPGKDDKLPT